MRTLSELLALVGENVVLFDIVDRTTGERKWVAAKQDHAWHRCAAYFDEALDHAATGATPEEAVSALLAILPNAAQTEKTKGMES